MRILIVTNHFKPESFRVNDVAFELSRRGHCVTVLTAIPDYPKGHFFAGYGYFKRRVETIDGVRVVRAAVIPRGKGRSLRMAINYLSVAVSFTLHGLYLAFAKRFDYVFVHDTSPAFIIGAACIVKRVQHTPLDVWILDMWPESLVAGGVKSRLVYRLIHRMMDHFYHCADLLHISSHGFGVMLQKRGVDGAKVRYLPNWADSSMSAPPAWRLPALPEGFIIMFAGNLGEAQDMEHVLQAAALTRHDADLHWVFVGDGRKRPWMEQFVEQHHLGATVHLMGRYPIETMPLFFARAHVMLVSLADKETLNMTLPAKVQAYMSNAKPLLAMMNGEGHDIVEAARCGSVVGAGQAEQLAAKATEMKQMKPEELQQLGQNGLQYYNRHFSYEVCMNEILRSIEQSEQSGRT